MVAASVREELFSTEKQQFVFFSFHSNRCAHTHLRAHTLGFIDMVIFVGHLVGQALKLGFQ